VHLLHRGEQIARASAGRATPGHPVQVALGGAQAGVPEQHLQLMERQARLELVGGVGVATGIITLLINRVAFRSTTPTTPTTANRSSAFAACAAKQNRRSS